MQSSFNFSDERDAATFIVMAYYTQNPNLITPDGTILPLLIFEPYISVLEQANQIFSNPRNRNGETFVNFIKQTPNNPNAPQYSGYGYINLPPSFYQEVGISDPVEVDPEIQLGVIVEFLGRGLNPNIPDHWGRYLHQISYLSSDIWTILLNEYEYPVCQPNPASSAIATLQQDLLANPTVAAGHLQAMVLNDLIVNQARLGVLLVADQSCKNPNVIDALINNGQSLAQQVSDPNLIVRVEESGVAVRRQGGQPEYLDRDFNININQLSVIQSALLQFRQTM